VSKYREAKNGKEEEFNKRVEDSKKQKSEKEEKE